MAGSPPDYWGYLVKSDKNPSPIFEQLLLGIANYINGQIAPWDVTLLTPTKLAAYYRLVGGDLDPLFLDTPRASLSFIYQSLGCFHTLQPEKDPYSAPAVPALTAQGFVRWQTVQLLLEPDEHASFLQNAVKRLDIINPADGTPFPDRLPREALPSRPDPEMIQWHEGVAENLMTVSYAADNTRPSSATEHAQISDTTTESSIASSDDRPSLAATARYFTHPRPRPRFQPPPSSNLPQSIDHPPIGNYRRPHPWDPERRPSTQMRSPATSPFAQGVPDILLALIITFIASRIISLLAIDLSTTSVATHPMGHIRRVKHAMPTIIKPTRQLATIFPLKSHQDHWAQTLEDRRSAPLPGTVLNTSGDIRFKVPQTETTVTFTDRGPRRLYQTDLSLCLLEGMNKLFASAIKNRGDGLIAGDQFETNYGQARVLIRSFSPPTFSMTTAVGFDVLRAIGLFSSLYGYYEVKFDVYHQKLGHAGVGLVEFLNR
ncbi:MAG: hypothetical protein Q9186_003479 [Xanthomendoza sp. 1 TL-2023]